MTQQIGDGNTSETLNVGAAGQPVQIGGTAAALVAFHGATAVAQAANVTAVLTTGVATGLIGFATTAQLQTAVDAINSILTCLKNKGFMASS